MASVNDWTPEEDLAVINDIPVDGRSDAQCRTRKAFLKRNYVNVGWGDLVGKQKIYSPQIMQIRSKK